MASVYQNIMGSYPASSQQEDVYIMIMPFPHLLQIYKKKKRIDIQSTQKFY